jgi:thiosulfate/3-mercaptopyruvate sulfurtransferase
MRLRLLQEFKQPRSLQFLVGLIVVCIFIISLSFSSFAVSGQAKIQFVSPAWVAANGNSNNLRVLDVRNAPLDYIAGHLPNAVNIADYAFRGPNGALPVQYWDNDSLGKIFAQSGVASKSRVLVYSSGNDVLGATMVAYLLERSGVQDIYVLDGGYPGYKAAGQPTTKVFPRYKITDFRVQDNPAIRVSIDQVARLTGQPGVAFIDPRPAELFRGDRELWVRNGHIPGATNIPWQAFTQATSTQEDAKNPHKLKPLGEIRQILADKGISPSKDIIVTCSTGREATLQYIVLKHLLGYPKVRIYEGSWTEYSTTNLPVAKGA